MNENELGENVWGLEKYEFRALRYAEKYGIIDYEVVGDRMKYTETYKNEGTFTHIIDLDLMKEV